MGIILRHTVILIYFILIVSIPNSYANSFGQTCAPLPIQDFGGYLVDNTAYGYIQKNLDMKTHVIDACVAGGNELKFCIKNQASDTSPCTAVTMSIGNSSKLGDLSSNPEIGGVRSLADITLSVYIIDDKVCLTMPTSRGIMPLICREKNEPSVTLPEELPVTVCSPIGQSCYSGPSKSQSLLSFSGSTIDCLRKSLDKIFYENNECPASGNIELSIIKPFPAFQENMKTAVRAALILYVMVFGFKIVMNSEYVELNKISLFIVKFIFVLYFAVGININTSSNINQVQHNGMTGLALPILVNITSDWVEMVFLAGGSQGLCNFDVNKYQSGYRFYKIWDAIDCRVGYYLGLQALHDIGGAILPATSSTTRVGNPISAVQNSSSSAYDVLTNKDALSFFAVMTGFFLAGKIIITILNLLFVVMFLSVVLYFITTYLVCMVTLYVMAYISPIFIPMILFEPTKAYFESWLKIVVSSTLQPAVIGAFIALILTMYDSAIYGNCEFQRHDYSIGSYSFSTFELREPNTDVQKCKDSFGYKMRLHYLGAGWEERTTMIFVTKALHDTLDLGPSLMYVALYAIIFYFFVQSINEFASDLTSGPSMATVSVSPTAAIDKAGSMAYGAAANAYARMKPVPEVPSLNDEPSREPPPEDTSPSGSRSESSGTSRTGGMNR